MRCLLLGAVVASVAQAFVASPGGGKHQQLVWRGAQQVASYEVEILEKQEALYDLVYVERIAPPETTGGGIFLVAPEDPPMHVAKVISVGPGLEGESGHVSENKGVKPGDYVFCKWPWGIGPKDEQGGNEVKTHELSHDSRRRAPSDASPSSSTRTSRLSAKQPPNRYYTLITM